MSRNILRQYPAGAQLLIFMVIWFICQLLTAGIIFPAIVKLAGSGITLENFQQDPGAFPAVAMWLNFTSAVFLFFVPAVVFAFVISPQPGSYVGLKKPAPVKILPWLTLTGVAMMLVLPGISQWLQTIGLGSWADQLQRARLEMESVYFTDRSAGGLLRNILLLALVPAFCEEIFFRGIIQRFAYALSGRKWAALLCTSLLFGLVHNSVYNFLPIFIASLLLGHLYLETGSLWTSIFLHFIYNMAQIAVVHTAPPGSEVITEDPAASIAIGIAGIAAIILSLRRIRRGANHHGQTRPEEPKYLS